MTSVADTGAAAYEWGNPAAILAPSLVATLISAVVAVVFCKLMDRG